MRKKKRWITKHHLVPKSRGGGNHKSNLLRIDGFKHIELHRIFGNRTLDEIIAILIRLRNAKKRQDGQVREM